MTFPRIAFAALTAAFAGCADGHAQRIVPLPFEESPLLTDTNSAPSMVEVYLVATVSTVEYLAGKSPEVWAYRDGAVAGSVGTVPGPMLRAKIGDEVIVHFRNELPRETTVHWHGPRVPQKADGSHASQHPVASGETFEYRFVAKDAGSFWYHPHVDGYEQVERGLYGPMVLEGDVAPEVTAERYLVLDDVKLMADGSLSNELSDFDRLYGREGNHLLVNGRVAPVALDVTAGARERWRIVNAANGRFFNLRMPGLRFHVIGTDGGLLPEPYWIDVLLVVPGERYDILVTFDGAPGTQTSLQTIDYDRGHGIASAGPLQLVRVEYGARGPAPGPLPAKWRDLPRLEVGPGTPIRRFELGDIILPGGALFFTINGDFWPGNQPIEVKQGDIEIWEISNNSHMDHPIHLHGMFFEVLAATLRDGPPLGGWKDTVNVPRRSAVRLAVQFDPPGIWMLHCHILEHTAAGMLVDVIVRD